VSDDSPVIILTTTGSEDDAQRIAREIVSENLAACVNLIPAVRSIYKWKGELHDDAEQLLVVKTVRRRLDAVKRRILELHPYDVPELIVLDVDDVDEAYLQWMTESTR